MIIEPMTAADITRIADLERQCFVMPWTKAMLEEELDNPRARFLVACEGESVAGYVGAYVLFTELEIANLAVSPDCRRQGVARALMTTLLKKAADEGVVSFTLEVRISNLAAIALYQGLGFQSVGIRKKYYLDNNEDALIMWKEDGARTE